jgi:hypothetical protein
MTVAISDFLFGPLDTEYCLYFYILSVINYIAAIFLVVALLASLVLKKFDMKNVGTLGFGALLYFIIYFQNRLLYSMCIKKDGFR